MVAGDHAQAACGHSNGLHDTADSIFDLIVDF
jgi:hypothetical protein